MTKEELKTQVQAAELADDLKELLLGKIDAASEEDVEMILQDAIHEAIAKTAAEEGIEIPANDPDMAAAKAEMETEMAAASSKFAEDVHAAAAPINEAIANVATGAAELEQGMARSDVDAATAE
jgi:hypothetical protein